MVSNNVWVEATVHPDSYPFFDLGWGGISEPPSKLHVTLAFTTYDASMLSVDFVVDELRPILTKAVEELPTLVNEECQVSGAAILQPLNGNFGVFLLQNQLLWSYNAAFSRVFTAEGVLDLTYPGWLPHITLCEGVTNYHDIEVLHRAAEQVSTVKLDGVWLRAGRICVPL